MRNRFVIFALSLLLLAFPVAAAEDFTQRDTCYWLVNSFTDEDILSAEEDHCPADPAQMGENDIDWAALVTVDPGDAPAGSPAGSDSTLHSYEFASSTMGSIAVDNFGTADMMIGGWWKPTRDDGHYLVRYGTNGSNEGEFHALKQSDLDQFWKMSGTRSPAGPDFGHLPTDSWTFLAFSSNAGSGSGLLRIFTSQSQIANTLFDCTGGTQDCTSDPVGMTLTKAFTFHINSVGSMRFVGNAYELWMVAEAPSEGEVCEMCQCGFPGNVRGIGRIDLCNRCEPRPYHGCRRFID